MIIIERIDVRAVEESQTEARVVYLRIQGWALADIQIDRLDLIVGDQVITSGAYGAYRADIAERFPDLPHADHAGFTIQTQDFLFDRAEPVLLTLKGTKRDGETIQVSARVDVEVEPSSSIAALPSISRIAPMRLHVESAEVSPSGMLRVAGWVLSLSPLIAVQIFLGDRRLGSAETGRAREDIAKAYSEYSNAARSGFSFVTQVDSQQLAALHSVRVESIALGAIVRSVTVPVGQVATDVVLQNAYVESLDDVRLHCDELTITTSGWMRISGWALGPYELESIRVYVDGEQVGEAKYGTERPDVGNAYPAAPNASCSGFAFQQRVRSSMLGESTFILQVVDRFGATKDFVLSAMALEIDLQFDAEPSTFQADDDLKIALDEPAILANKAVNKVKGTLTITGWALARSGVKTVRVYLDGVFAGNAYYGMRREDIMAAFPDWENTLLSGFALSIPGRGISAGHHDVRVELVAADEQTKSLEFTFEAEQVVDETGAGWIRRRMSRAETDLQMQILDGLEWKPQFELLLRLKASDRNFEAARRTIDSLGTQVYPSWRLTIVAADARQARAASKAFVSFKSYLSEKFKIVIATSAHDLNVVLASKADDNVIASVLGSGDEFGCDWLLEVALQSGLDPTVDVIYWDERRPSPVDGVEDAFFKPNWSPDLQLSMNYIGHAFAARPELFGRAHVTTTDLRKHSDYDLALRVTEAAQKVGHIQKVLSRRDVKPWTGKAAEKRALIRALRRRKIDATVVPGSIAGTYRVKNVLVAAGLVSIIIPSVAARGLIETCIKTLRDKTAYPNVEIIICDNIRESGNPWKTWFREHADKVVEIDEPFNWSRFNNLGAAVADGEYLLFLNDDIEVLDPDWLETLVSICQRPEVGVVGPLLYYPDLKVQHAGIFLTDVGGRHAFRFNDRNDPGYFALRDVQRNMIAVTGACLLTRRDVFDQIGRFDEAHNVINNDLDYCLRSWEAGYLNVYTPHTQLIHHELVSRATMKDEYDSTAFVQRWQRLFADGDPFYNFNLTKSEDIYSPEHEPAIGRVAGHPVFHKSEVQRIVALKLDHIGDFVTALPAFRRLKELFPGAKLTVVAAKAAVQLAQLESSIDEVIVFEFFHARSGLGQKDVTEEELEQLSAQLRPHRFDLAIDLRKAIDTRHVLKYTNARYFAGYDHRTKFPWLDVALEWDGDTRLTSKRYHITDDLLHLVDALDAASRTDRSIVTVLPAGELGGLPIDRALINELEARPYVCMHIGAGTELRQWPAEHYATLSDLLIEDGYTIVLVGGPDEVPKAQEVKELVRRDNRLITLAGLVPLSKLPIVMMKSVLYVGNNSGPHHIAASLGVPVIGIHSGVVDAAEWGPLGPQAMAIQRSMNCSPCYISAAEDCHRGLACIKALVPGTVHLWCKRMLALRSPLSKRSAT